MKKVLLLLPLLSLALPVHAVGPWRVISGADSGVETHARLMDRRGDNAFVQTRTVMFGEWIKAGDLSYTINCANEVMVNSAGWEFAKIRGIWRFTHSNRPHDQQELFDWACR